MCDFIQKSAILRYWAPSPLGGLGATYDDHLKLIGKHVVDFVLVLIELFSLGVTAEALRANIGSKSAISLQRGPVDSTFQVEMVVPTNHSSYQKIRLNDLSYGIKIWTDHYSILLQITRFSDGQTDGQTEFSSLDRICIACSAVKSRFLLDLLDSTCYKHRLLEYMLSLVKLDGQMNSTSKAALLNVVTTDSEISTYTCF